MKKKCSICKEYFEIHNAYEPKYIYAHKAKKDRFYHFDCYFNEELNKQKGKQRKQLTIEQIENKLKTIFDTNVAHIQKIFDDQKLLDFIHTHYNIVSIPMPFKIKLDAIYNGDCEGLSRGISSVDLLDMWQRKKQELDKLYNYNQQKGKELDRSSRINYDLAVLLSKYDSFLEWKEKEKVLEQTINIDKAYDQISLPKINNINGHEQIDKEFADILDDLF